MKKPTRAGWIALAIMIIVSATLYVVSHVWIESALLPIAVYTGMWVGISLIHLVFFWRQDRIAAAIWRQLRKDGIPPVSMPGISEHPHVKWWSNPLSVTGMVAMTSFSALLVALMRLLITTTTMEWYVSFLLQAGAVIVGGIVHQLLMLYWKKRIQQCGATRAAAAADESRLAQ